MIYQRFLKGTDSFLIFFLDDLKRKKFLHFKP
jgi:hypothetical protein